VREQIEHDRLIRLLQATYRRKCEALANVGEEQVAPVKIGANVFYPDLVLSHAKHKKLSGLVEVETGESVNNLEAMAQWTHFSHARVPFHLYVPVTAIDAARRLCAANNVRVAEIWTYRSLADQFDFVRAYHDASVGAASARRAAPNASRPSSRRPPARKPVAKAAAKRAKKPSAARRAPAGKARKTGKRK
jgi:hypothetical protein